VVLERTCGSSTHDSSGHPDPRGAVVVGCSGTQVPLHQQEHEEQRQAQQPQQHVAGPSLGEPGERVVHLQVELLRDASEPQEVLNTEKHHQQQQQQHTT